MRNRRIGLVGALLIGGTVAATGCGGSSSGGAGGRGGSSSPGDAGMGGTSSGGGSGQGGGGGTGGSSSPVTTLSGSKAVNALTPAEVTQLCDDTWAYFGAAIPKAAACKWKGLTFGASSSAPSDTVLRQNCTMGESTCQQTTDPWAGNPGCNDIPSTCTATVAQYSTCVSDEVAMFIQIVNGFPMCASLTGADTSAILTAAGSDPPASCASLMNACPDLYPPNPLPPQ